MRDLTPNPFPSGKGRFYLGTLVGFSIAILAISSTHAASEKPAHASAQVSALVDRLQEHYQQTKSFFANFTEVISPAGGAKRERTGTVYYRKPGQMRWEFAGQDQEVLVSDGKLLYSYEPDLNQVIETPLEQAFKSSSTAAFLLGIGQVRRDFDASTPATTPADGLKHIVLKPKNGSDSFEVGVDPATLDLKSLRLADALGDVTELAFSDIKRDTPLDDKLFTFIPPAGADIVKAPQQPNSH
ncbi:MAG TPA: outer membrane lipoprotein carrier protein LolA [Candidatus Binataceae bacterium]|nr:outer membrane lipoprotein carrier protein LolA [Candidatus Binataceae bacterium]